MGMEPTIDEVKFNLRQQMKTLLKNMTSLEHLTRSAKITSRVLNSAIWKKTSSIAFFNSRQDEPDTQTLIQTAWDAKRRVILPKVEGHSLGFYAVRHASELVLGAFNLLEPNTQLCQAVPLSELELMIVPGLAFDKHRSRLGRGKGYYDRALSQLPVSCPSVGLFFKLQQVSHVPQESHDVSLDYVVTEDVVFSENS